MKTLAMLAVAGITVGVVVPLAAGAEPQKASVPLRGLVAVGSIVATAAEDTMDEAVLRTTVERRFARAGITIDAAAPVDLIVDVSAERDRSEDGHCTFEKFVVYLALREPVSIDRAPGETFPAITWHRQGSVSHFGSRTPKLTILDLVQQQISTFLRARGVEQQAPAEKADHP